MAFEKAKEEKVAKGEIESNTISIPLQKKAYIRHREVEMVGHIGVDHFAGIHIEAGSKAAVEPGKMGHTTAIAHGGEHSNKNIAQGNGGGSCHA